MLCTDKGLRIHKGLLAAVLTALLAMLPWRAMAAEPIKIGLITALSGQSALAGEAITRGLQTAIDEINADGGLLDGRELVLVRRDDEANPAKGLIELANVMVIAAGMRDVYLDPDRLDVEEQEVSEP